MDLKIFSSQLRENLDNNILAYWLKEMVDPRGGFYGRRDGDDNLDPEAPKGAILNARILWSFAAAYRATGKAEYLDASKRAYDYIVENFIDNKFGGAFWSLNADGSPLDTKKQFYAIAFIIYGLSEYYLATGDEALLSLAYDLFLCIEEHSRDRMKGGYVEAATREWEPIADMRLSEHDANSSKTMNTHLHILEGYTNLLRALKYACGKNPDAETLSRKDIVEEATASLLEIFLFKIENPETHHLTLFFDDDWNKVDDTESFGHDIEASWLMLESAEVIGRDDLYQTTLAHTADIARAGLEGSREDGSMIYELHPDGRRDADLHWWVQAESVIGQLYMAYFHNAAGYAGEKEYEEGAWKTWRFIADNLVDPAGEWHWSVKADGSINRTDDKAGFWKCPYHNSRMCLEAGRILSLLEIRNQN